MTDAMVGRKSRDRRSGLFGEETRYVVVAVDDNGMTERMYASGTEDARKAASLMGASCKYDHVNIYSRRGYVMMQVSSILEAHMYDGEYDEMDVTDYVNSIMGTNQDLQRYSRLIDEEMLTDLIAHINYLVEDDLLNKEEEEAKEKKPFDEVVSDFFDQMRGAIDGIESAMGISKEKKDE